MTETSPYTVIPRSPQRWRQQYQNSRLYQAHKVIGFCGRGTWKRLTLFCLGKSGAINSPRSYCLSTVWAGSWQQVVAWGILPSGQCRRYEGGDIVVSHSLLWRPWVTVRISESLSDISFLNFILNAIFYISEVFGLFRYL